MYETVHEFMNVILCKLNYVKISLLDKKIKMLHKWINVDKIDDVISKISPIFTICLAFI